MNSFYIYVVGLSIQKIDKFYDQNLYVDKTVGIRARNRT